VRGRSRAGKVQLDLFAAPRPLPTPTSPALDLLKAVDIDRLTPLEALTLLAKLKTLA